MSKVARVLSPEFIIWGRRMRRETHATIETIVLILWLFLLHREQSKAKRRGRNQGRCDGKGAGAAKRPTAPRRRMPRKVGRMSARRQTCGVYVCIAGGSAETCKHLRRFRRGRGRASSSAVINKVWMVNFPGNKRLHPTRSHVL